MKKVLFRPIENDKDQPASPDNVVEDPEVEDSCQVWCFVFVCLFVLKGHFNTDWIYCVVV